MVHGDANKPAPVTSAKFKGAAAMTVLLTDLVLVAFQVPAPNSIQLSISVLFASHKSSVRHSDAAADVKLECQ